MLAGGVGDDLYLLEHSSPKVVEGSAQGHDSIHSSESATTLAANVEDLIYFGSSEGSFVGTVNRGDNRIVAAAGSDTLKGAAGDDTLEGRAGKDALTGGDGDDSLHGGAGHDLLTGGEGADRFVFDSALGAAHNVDRVADFTAGDFIVLDRNVFGAAGPQARLAGDAFVLGTAAADTEDRLITTRRPGGCSTMPTGRARGRRYCSRGWGRGPSSASPTSRSSADGGLGRRLGTKPAAPVIPAQAGILRAGKKRGDPSFRWGDVSPSFR